MPVIPWVFGDAALCSTCLLNTLQPFLARPHLSVACMNNSVAGHCQTQNNCIRISKYCYCAAMQLLLIFSHPAKALRLKSSPPALDPPSICHLMQLPETPAAADRICVEYGYRQEYRLPTSDTRSTANTHITGCSVPGRL